MPSRRPSRCPLLPMLLALATPSWSSPSVAAAPAAPPSAPVDIIFDTDIGNDVDDVLALGLIHALVSRGECELLAVTITKDNPLAAPFTDAINRFYGRGDVPIGMVRGGVTPEDGKYLPLATARTASPSSFHASHRFSRFGTFATGANAGNIYVGSYGNSTVTVLSPNGTILDTVAVDYPTGIAIAP